MCLINLFFSGLIFILYYFAQNNLYYDYDLLIQLLLFLTISEINMLMLMLMLISDITKKIKNQIVQLLHSYFICINKRYQTI